MKRITIIAAAMLLTIAGFAQDGKSIYKKYSDAENVSAVYISPSMFRMVGQIPDLELKDEDINLTPIIKSLNGLYLVNSENKQINSRIRDDVETFVKSGKYELLMEMKDQGDTVHIYTSGDEDTVTGFVMLAYENDECTFICLDGQMPRRQLEELLARAGK